MALIAYLHVTDGNAVVSAVSDDLVLNLLPTLHAPLNKDLRAGCKSFCAELDQFLLVLRESRPETTQSERSSDNDWISNLSSCCCAFWNIDSRS